MVAPLVYAIGVGAVRVGVWAAPRVAPLFMSQAARWAGREAVRRIARQAASTACSTCCPPCNPPVGSILFEIHRVPPSVPHAPCTGDHIHYFVQRQNPNGCQCFMTKEKEVDCLNPGEQPDTSGMFPTPNQTARGS